MSDKVLGGDNDLAQENDGIEVVLVCWMYQWVMYTLLLTLYMIRRSVYSRDRNEAAVPLLLIHRQLRWGRCGGDKGY
jgi:hypothetical protein